MLPEARPRHLQGFKLSKACIAVAAVSLCIRHGPGACEAITSHRQCGTPPCRNATVKPKRTSLYQNVFPQAYTRECSAIYSACSAHSGVRQDCCRSQAYDGSQLSTEGCKEVKKQICVTMPAFKHLLQPNPTHRQDRSAHLVALFAPSEAALAHLNGTLQLSLVIHPRQASM